MNLLIAFVVVGVLAVGLSYMMLTKPERDTAAEEAAYQNRLRRAFTVDGKELMSTEIATHPEVLRAALYQKSLVSPDPWCQPRS